VLLSQSHRDEAGQSIRNGRGYLVCERHYVGGESGGGVVKPATTQPSTDGRVGVRVGEMLGRVCVCRGLGGHAAETGYCLAMQCEPLLAVVDPSTCFVDVR
jgi:hypothetical protein